MAQPTPSPPSTIDYSELRRVLLEKDPEAPSSQAALFSKLRRATTLNSALRTESSGVQWGQDVSDELLEGLIRRFNISADNIADVIGCPDHLDQLWLSCGRVSKSFSHAVHPLMVYMAPAHLRDEIITPQEGFTGMAMHNRTREEGYKLGLLRTASNDHGGLYRMMRTRADRGMRDAKPAELLLKRKLHRLSSLIETRIWKNESHPILHGMVDVTNMTCNQILQTSAGKSHPRLITQADLEDFVRDKANIFAVSHRHRCYEPGDAGWGISKNVVAGMSRKTAEMMVRRAETVKGEGKRMIAWVDNFHTRLRRKSWGPECLLPYLLFDVLEMDVLPEEQSSRMWLHLEKRMLDFSNEQKADDMETVDVHGMQTSEGLTCVAIDLMLGKYDKLEATYPADKVDMKEWAENNFDLIMMGTLDSKSERSVAHSDHGKVALLDYLMGSKCLSYQYCYRDVVEDGEGGGSWRGVFYMVPAELLKLFGPHVVSNFELKRVAKTTWVVNPSRTQALLLWRQSDEHLASFVYLVDLQSVHTRGKLVARFKRGRFFHLRGVPMGCLHYILANYVQEGDMQIKFQFALAICLLLFRLRMALAELDDPIREFFCDGVSLMDEFYLYPEYLIDFETYPSEDIDDSELAKIRKEAREEGLYDRKGRERKFLFVSTASAPKLREMGCTIAEKSLWDRGS